MPTNNRPRRLVEIRKRDGKVVQNDLEVGWLVTGRSLCLEVAFDDGPALPPRLPDGLGHLVPLGVRGKRTRNVHGDTPERNGRFTARGLKGKEVRGVARGPSQPDVVVSGASDPHPW